jgi:DNA-binding SARP family transcriptional activator
MAQIDIRLFGRFTIQSSAGVVTGLRSTKAQELFAYLLLHRDRPQPREVMAESLWADSDSPHARKYLRQTLWQLQATLRPLGAVGRRMLRIEADWVELRSVPEMRLDAALLQDASAKADRLDGAAFDESTTELFRAAVAACTDEFLPGWYQRWCMAARDRLQADYKKVLDALIADCEARALTSDGLHYAALSLLRDRACERTHRRIMRLHCLAGDRAAALRQYDRCVIALDEELGVPPAAETRALYEQIRRGAPPATVAPVLPSASHAVNGLTNLLGQLRQMGRALDEYRQQVQASIQAVEHALADAPAAGHLLPARPPLQALPRPTAHPVVIGAEGREQQSAGGRLREGRG